MEPITIAGLSARYAAGEVTPREVLAEVERRIEARGDEGVVWIARHSAAGIEAQVAELEVRRARGDMLPLYGIPFAVKDNIDALGLATTAGCPAFAYDPSESSTAVRRLLHAGAILVGKTNLDQFATGLVGTRSPSGFPRCVANPDYISGGSSSGSAVVVAGGVVAFSLGTDTAGSGRVPAAFNGIVGLKPTRGRISTQGVVPACRSLDCVSIFAHTPEDTATVLRVMEGEDPGDPYSRPVPSGSPMASPNRFRFGTPPEEQWEFFGDREASELFRGAIARLERIGGERVEFDYTPFLECAELLYGGPWVAERDAAVGDFIRANPDSVHPVVRSIILGGSTYSAVDAFRAMYRLEELRVRTRPVWEAVELLLLPTTGTIFRADDVLADPIATNTKLGYYTNFMNLLDLCGVALPAGARRNRTPFGITLVGPAFSDNLILALATRFEGRSSYGVALADSSPLAEEGGEGPPTVSPREGESPEVSAGPEERVRLAVVGAHLSGQPLNHQLTGRGARLLATTRTLDSYKLYALAGTVPPKPGLVWVEEGGASIEIEVWELGPAEFGSFVAEVPPPLAIGTLELEDGALVKGFVCEPRALEGALDITAFGGWRGYLRDGTGW